MTKRARLGGFSDEGTPPRATFYIGLKADKPRPGSIVRRKGERLPVARARAELLKLRGAQIGWRRAAATLTNCRGQWQDTGQPSLTCDIVFFPAPRERTQRAFRENMLNMAELAAERLGQREVLLRIDRRAYRANAPGERGPKPYNPRGKILK